MGRLAVRLLHAGRGHDRQGLARQESGSHPAEVREALTGNLCRCGCYEGIAHAVLASRATAMAGGADASAALRAPGPAPLRRHIPAARRRLERQRRGGLRRRRPRQRCPGLCRQVLRAPSRTPASSASTPRVPRRYRACMRADVCRPRDRRHEADQRCLGERQHRLLPAHVLSVLRDRRVLSDHVTWVGDEAGVVIAAESEEIAEDALRLLDVEWERLRSVWMWTDALSQR